MAPLLSSLSDTVGAVFLGLGLPPELGFVKVSDRPDLAQFQCNGAMAAAKKLGKNPREVAGMIVDALQKNAIFAKVEAVGPGFININLTDAAIADHLGSQRTDKNLGIPQIGAGKNVLLDYGGPNAAKPMHVGHLRPAIIGDTLRRILLATGYGAVGDIHFGDWGLQAGMVISELEIRHPEWPYFVAGATGPFPATCPLSFDDLAEIYPTASANSKADEARMERARLATVELQKRHAGYNALWDQIVAMSKDAMRDNYAALNVHFDLWLGEKDVDHIIPDMVADMRTQGFAIESEGAIVVPVAKNDDKKEIPPVILIKSDGAYLYATTDLATIVDRMEFFPKPDWMIYVVDQRQNLHFEQVFRAARLTKLLPDQVKLDFAGFGTMNGPDGKPFKTRAGGVLNLQDLIQMGIDKALVRMTEAKIANDSAEAEKEETARQVAVAAIRFADLKNPRHVDYVFDLDAMTSFEGKTGPYLLYQTVRIKSVLAKTAAQGLQPSGQFVLSDDDRALGLLLLDFPNAVTMSIDNLSAHTLADYLHRLAQEFSSFYARCHILNEPDATRQGALLTLCVMTHDTLVKGLGLMGITVPERM